MLWPPAARAAESAEQCSRIGIIHQLVAAVCMPVVVVVAAAVVVVVAAPDGCSTDRQSLDVIASAG